MILSADLNWDKHYNTITAHAYKSVGANYYVEIFSPVIQLSQWLSCMYHWSNHNYSFVLKYAVYT